METAGLRPPPLRPGLYQPENGAGEALRLARVTTYSVEQAQAVTGSGNIWYRSCSSAMVWLQRPRKMKYSQSQ